MNNIFLFDHKHQPFLRSDWATALASVGVPDANVFGKSEPPQKHDAYKAGNIIFCHSPGLEGTWIKMVTDNIIQGSVVFVRSVDRQGTKMDRERVYGCYWRPKEFEKSSPKEVKEFIQSLKAGKPRFELLQPRNKSESPDLLPALAVLCQGYLLAMKPEANIPNKAKEAVQTSAWWKQPFHEFADMKTFSAELESEWGEKIPDSVENLVAEVFSGSTIADATVEAAARAMAGRLGY